MKKYIFIKTLKRFFEITFCCVATSMIAFALIAGKLIEGNIQITAMLTIAFGIYLLFNYKKQRQRYINYFDHKKLYYKTNIGAYILFTLLVVLCKYTLSDFVFSWFFVITKFLTYTETIIPDSVSYITFFAVSFLSIIFSRVTHEKIVLYYISNRNRRF